MSAAAHASGNHENASTPNDTVAELLTPTGAGAIGVIRVRGPQAGSIVSAVCNEAPGQTAEAASSRRNRAPRVLAAPGADGTDRLTLRTLFDDGEPIDDVIFSAVPSASVPTFDFCAHGGTRVLERVLRALQRHGARIVDSENERCDPFDATTFVEREISAALRLAKTETAALFLVRQRALIPKTLRELAERAQREPRKARTALERLDSSWPAVRLLLHGATVALVGPPNAGKSTLFNALAGRTVAVASPIPGTTRDWVTADTEFDGVPIRLIDTPGDRATVDPLEAEAIRVGRRLSAAADLRILLQETPARNDARGDTLFPVGSWGRAAQRAELVVHTKIDLDPCDVPTAGDVPSGSTARPTVREKPAVRVSAVFGKGLEDLRQAVLAALSWNPDYLHAAAIVSDRQAQIVSSTLASPDNILYRGIVALIEGGVPTPPK